MPEKRVRRVWVQNVAVSVKVLETRLDVAEAQGLGPDQKAAAAGVRELLRSARDAAFGVQPRPNRLSNWWRGTLVDAAYQNLHAARALMVDVYDDAEVAAEIPIAVARSQRTLHRDDPRRLGPEAFTNRSEVQRRAFLRRIIKDGYDALDRQHERLRSFRNINLTLAVFIAVLVGATVAFVSAGPQLIPLCFPASGQANGGALQNCPTGSGVAGPSGDDILVVSLLGLLGGALAAATSIRNLRGTSTPYDLPVALALLKVPLGAFTAILGLVAIRGDFVPGLSALDSQHDAPPAGRAARDGLRAPGVLRHRPRRTCGQVRGRAPVGQGRGQRRDRVEHVLQLLRRTHGEGEVLVGRPRAEGGGERERTGEQRAARQFLAHRPVAHPQRDQQRDREQAGQDHVSDERGREQVEHLAPVRLRDVAEHVLVDDHAERVHEVRRHGRDQQQERRHRLEDPRQRDHLEQDEVDRQHHDADGQHGGEASRACLRPQRPEQALVPHHHEHGRDDQRQPARRDPGAESRGPLGLAGGVGVRGGPDGRGGAERNGTGLVVARRPGGERPVRPSAPIAEA
jgi:hypothetical protein